MKPVRENKFAMTCPRSRFMYGNQILPLFHFKYYAVLFFASGGNGLSAVIDFLNINCFMELQKQLTETGT